MVVVVVAVAVVMVVVVVVVCVLAPVLDRPAFCGLRPGGADDCRCLFAWARCCANGSAADAAAYV